MKGMKHDMMVPPPGGKSGPKYVAAAKGGSLAEGTSHYEKIGGDKIDGAYPRKEPETNQRPAKGSDRI